MFPLGKTHADKITSSCEDGFGSYYGDCYSAWNSWVRWVVFGVVIAIFLLLFLTCSCMSARRRRAAGLRPYYGTGWTQRAYYANGPGYWGQPAPPYGVQDPNGPPPYHHQQTGIELQPPVNSYQPQREANDDYEPNVYEPPIGPPPKKNQTTYIR